MKNFRLLFLGDVVGPRSAEYVSKNLWKLRKDLCADAAIVNGENCAAGNGIDRDGAFALISGGADVITTGNHVFKRFEASTLLDDEPRILRPANYPSAVSGNGYSIFEAAGKNILVINLLGVINLEPLESPFDRADKILRENQGKFDISIIDFHAEATSEKAALAFYLDGRAGAVIGTHTHVQTCDEKILPKGTAFITDAGMCGPSLSVLGVKPEIIIKKLTLHTPVKFELSENLTELHGVLIEFDGEKNVAVKIERINL